MYEVYHKIFFKRKITGRINLHTETPEDDQISPDVRGNQQLF